MDPLQFYFLNIVLTRLYGTVWNEVARANILVLLMILGRNIYSYTIKYDVRYKFFLDDYNPIE